MAVRFHTLRFPCLIVALLSLLAAVSTASAQSAPAWVQALAQGDAYIAPSAIKAGKATQSDLQKLQSEIRAEANRGVAEKVAIIGGVSATPGETSRLASRARADLNFSGILILVSNRGIGISSGSLSRDEENSIAQRNRGTCELRGLTACAVSIGHDAASQVKNDESSSTRNVVIFWLIVVVILGLILWFLVRRTLRRRSAETGRLDELRRAASATLSIADSAVEQIERATQTSPRAMAPDLRSDYDRALGLRETARVGLEKATTPEGLIQANEDSAQAVLGLQGVMRRLGIQSPLSSPLDAPGHRCFYCGRDDRPPYTRQTIDDGRGSSMEVEVCAVDAQRLKAGRKPEVNTVNYGGTVVPWWAVPGNPYYYTYGGPSWQYWLPFVVGMDLGMWMGGGWGEFGYGADWDDTSSGVDDSGAAGGIDTPSDAGGADFGGWGGGSDSSGGWGGDSGGSDFGGSDWGSDSGGGDW